MNTQEVKGRPHSGVGDAVESVKTATSNDIQEKMFLDGCLMWHYAAV